MAKVVIVVESGIVPPGMSDADATLLTPNQCQPLWWYFPKVNVPVETLTVIRARLSQRKVTHDRAAQCMGVGTSYVRSWLYGQKCGLEFVQFASLLKLLQIELSEVEYTKYVSP